MLSIVFIKMTLNELFYPSFKKCTSSSGSKQLFRSNQKNKQQWSYPNLLAHYMMADHGLYFGSCLEDNYDCIYHRRCNYSTRGGRIHDSCVQDFAGVWKSTLECLAWNIFSLKSQEWNIVTRSMSLHSL